jgi:hypothetical protein
MSYSLRTIILTFALMAFTGAGSTFAAGRGGGGHGGGGSHGHSGGHHHGSHTRLSIGVGFGAGWYPWGGYGWPYYSPYYPYYPAPAYYSPPPYYVQPPQQSYTYYSSEPDNYWYYCAASKAYYPYVKDCPGGQWERVQPHVPPPGSDNVRVDRAP